MFRKFPLLQYAEPGLEAAVALAVVAATVTTIAAVVIPASTVVTATTAMAASATMTTTSAVSAATPAGAVFSFADPERASAKFGSFEIVHGCFADFTVGKGNECETAWTSGVAVERHVQVDDRFVFRQKFAEFDFRGLVRHVADVQLH